MSRPSQAIGFCSLVAASAPPLDPTDRVSAASRSVLSTGEGLKGSASGVASAGAVSRRRIGTTCGRTRGLAGAALGAALAGGATGAGAAGSGGVHSEGSNWAERNGNSR